LPLSFGKLRMVSLVEPFAKREKSVKERIFLIE